MQNLALKLAQLALLFPYILVYDHGVRWIAIEIDGFRVLGSWRFAINGAGYLALCASASSVPAFDLSFPTYYGLVLTAS